MRLRIFEQEVRINTAGNSCAIYNIFAPQSYKDSSQGARSCRSCLESWCWLCCTACAGDRLNHRLIDTGGYKSRPYIFTNFTIRLCIHGSDVPAKFKDLAENGWEYRCTYTKYNLPLATVLFACHGFSVFQEWIGNRYSTTSRYHRYHYHHLPFKCSGPRGLALTCGRWSFLTDAWRSVTFIIYISV